MQPDRQLRLLPACQAPTENLEDQFDSLIKDFHFAFVSVTWAVSQTHDNVNTQHKAVHSVPAPKCIISADIKS